LPAEAAASEIPSQNFFNAMAAARSQRSRVAPERLEATESISSSPTDFEVPKVRSFGKNML